MREALKNQEEVIAKVVTAFRNVTGIEAIVLGGSRVNGTSSEESNIDIGMYYLDNGMIDVDQFSQVLTELDDYKRTGLLALPGSWGKWLNGGSCIIVNGFIVDISLRNITRVKEVISNTLDKGEITVDFQFGHPYGFVSSMYLAEIDLCKPIFQKKGIMNELKRMVRPMTATYKSACINQFLWEASYCSQTGRRCIQRKDVIYAFGTLYKAANSLCQVVYTLNDTYLLNEKMCFSKMRTFKKMPPEFLKNMQMVFMALDENNISNAYDIIEYYIASLRNIAMSMGIQ